MKQPSTGSRLLQGAFILGLAAIISKIIGAFQKIPLQNLGETVYLASTIRCIRYICSLSRLLLQGCRWPYPNS